MSEKCLVILRITSLIIIQDLWHVVTPGTPTLQVDTLQVSILISDTSILMWG